MGGVGRNVPACGVLVTFTFCARGNMVDASQDVLHCVKSFPQVGDVEVRF